MRARPREITVLGGGPAGLYFAALAKKADPNLAIRVIERNPPDATYGWGVVFSDQTLSSFREADHPSFERLLDALVIWDAIEIRYQDSTTRCGGQDEADVEAALSGHLKRLSEVKKKYDPENLFRVNWNIAPAS